MFKYLILSGYSKFYGYVLFKPAVILKIAGIVELIMTLNVYFIFLLSVKVFVKVIILFGKELKILGEFEVEIIDIE